MLANRLTNWRARLSLLLLALLLSSCGRVRVNSPLSDPDKAKPDERLCGVWKRSNKESNDSGNAFLFIGKVGQPDVPSGIMKAVMIGIDSKNNIRDMPLYFFTTSAGDNSYANLFNLFEAAVFDRAKSPTWDKRNIKLFDIRKYKVEGDKLTVWEMIDNRVEAAVRKGKVKGTIEKKGNPKVTVVTLTDGGDLSRFLANGGDKVLFSAEVKMVWSRVK